jgi:hypothetical protein
MTRLLLAVLTIAAARAVAQTPTAPGQPQTEPIPVALALQDLFDTYSAGPTADEVSVKVTLRTPDRPETQVQTFTIRIDADPQSKELRRILLDLGPLRAYFGEGEFIAVSTASPEKFHQVVLDGPITQRTIEEHLPPIPAPQIAFAAGFALDRPIDLTPYTPSVLFSGAIANTRARQPSVVIAGGGSAGPVTLITDVQSARLLKLTADIVARQPAAIDLTCRPVDPGDPATWRPSIEGRQRVASVTQLFPSPPPRLVVGDLAPEISLSRPEHGVWSLRDALVANPGRPLAVVIWRWSREPDRKQATLDDAAAGAAALGRVSADTALVCAVALELADYRGAMLAEASDVWRQSLERSAAPASSPLYWSTSAARSIDRFSPEAGAIAVIIGADRRIRAVVRLDGAEPAEIESVFKQALAPDPEPLAEPPPPPG